MNKLFLTGKKILIFISFFIFYILLYKLFGLIFNIKDVNSISYVDTIVYFILCLYLFFIYQKEIINGFKSFTKNWKKLFLDNISIYIISMMIMYAINVILFTTIGSIATNEELSRQAITSSTIPALISMCIYAPFYEEILFRLNFRSIFNNKYIYVITVGLLFGSMHLLSIQNPIEILYIIPYSVMGMGFALMYYNTKNIFTSIMFHMLNNTAVILILFLGGSL